nr:zinc finger, C2H2-like protein [Tanacetum cinerariifolium]
MEPRATPTVVKPLATPMVMEEQLQDSLKDDKIVNEDESIRKGNRDQARSHMDLETKKQKIMQGGTSPASLRASTV